MKFTYDEDVYSDLHKDTYGFRPRNDGFYDAPPEVKQKMWDALLAAHDEEMEHYHRARKESIAAFEALIAKVLEAGAGDREHAIAWLRHAEQDEYALHDDGYFEYTYNLPYGYLKGLHV